MEKLHLQKLSWIEKQEDPEDLVFLYPAFPYTGNILAFYSEFLQNRLIININAERKSKVDDNTARMQSIKQLGV